MLVLLIAWVVYSRLSAKGQLTSAKWEPFLTGNLWKTYVLPGVEGTLTAAAVSIVLALVLGFLLGVGRLSQHGGVRWTCSVVVEFFRAVPVLVMMIFAYFFYATSGLFPSKYLALAGVITGLTLYNGAVIAEIVRAGGECPAPAGNPKPQRLLACAGARQCGAILLPQARHSSMLPVLVSQMVVVLKDTAIGYQITFLEMVRQGTQVGSAYGNYVPALIVIAVLMICVNSALGQLRDLARTSVAPLEARARPAACNARDAGFVRARAPGGTI